MKVINEATDIKPVENAYNNANSFEEKQEILNERIPELKASGMLDKLYAFGEPFLDSWIKAMKWTELLRDDNELVQALSERDIVNNITNASKFIKFYNTYAEGYFENKYLTNNVYRKLLTNDDTYKLNGNEFINAFKIFDSVYSKYESNKNLLKILSNVFLEDENHINSFNVIADRAKKYLGKEYRLDNDQRDQVENSNTNINYKNITDKRTIKSIINQLADNKVANQLTNNQLAAIKNAWN